MTALPRLRRLRPNRATGIALALALVAGAGVTAQQLTMSAGAAQPVTAPAPVAPLFPAADVDERDRPVATRSVERTRGPRVVPRPTAKDAACRLDLGYGVWALDITAARTLTMLTAVAYREGRNLAKAARTFERQLAQDGRTPLSADRAERNIMLKRKNPIPRTTSLDAVHAMFRPRALTCAQPIRTIPAQPELANGLTARTIAMLQGAFAAYGGRPLGGFAPGGVDHGHIENSAHYDGRAVDIFFDLDDADNNARGWLLAHWLVTHADYHQIETVIFDDTVWTRFKSTEGWRPYVHPSGDVQNTTLRHLNHIHVDVVQGVPAEGDQPEQAEGDQPEQVAAPPPSA